MKRTHLLVFSFLFLSAAVCFATRLNPVDKSVSRSGNPSVSDIELESDSVLMDSLCLDSIRQAQRIESFLIPAENSYKRLRSMRFDGFDEKDYYPALIECYDANVTFLDSLPAHPHAEASKGVILDIYKDLLDGAYYFSEQGNKKEMTRLARAYLDVEDIPAMAGEEIRYEQRALPTIAYIAASGAYNSQQFEDAIRYFDKYLATPDQNQRESVYTYLGQACLYAKDYDHAVTSMAEGAVLYPTNYNLLTLGLQACIDGGHGENIPFFLDKALLLRPNDEQLLNIQGQMYEDRQEYRAALDVYHRLDEIKPNNLSIIKHLALCYYNLGVHHYNCAILSEDEKEAKRHRRQCNAYFTEASQKLEEVLANDPLSIKYLKALAVTYGCCDEKEKFESVTTRLRALGQQPGKSAMPSMIAFKEDDTANFTSGGNNNVAVNQIPTYSEFGKTFITDGLANWATRGKFEKMDEYTARVSEKNVQAEYVRLCKEAEKAYLDQYGSKLRINDLKLGAYDPDNETYIIHSDYGDMTLNVPMKNNEAELFGASWNKIKLRAPKFYIHDDKPAISSLTFQTNGGRSYTYDAADAATYAYTDVIIDFNSIINSGVAAAGKTVAERPAANGGSTVITRQSDVDKNIPVVKRQNDNTIVLIFANENYQNVSKVASALHDGDIFEEYCQKTLGIPAHRIKYFKDATFVNVLEGLAFLKNAVKSQNGDVNVIVYYAGHGMPDEATKDAFLLPVDGNATISETCFSLNRLYDELNAMNANSTVVFLDACFSGAQRGDGMLVGARGIAIKPKAASPKGNMFVLSAASGQETAMPYTEKNHGMFTYYLLKKLQESKGNATLKEISDYVIRNVSEQSNVINKKPQNPQVSLSGNMGEMWKTRGLR
ncbi:MAG: caspase family protein [Muribaculaceae bacterium]|nr:caspase family protein [Muribaculaceae bacterium]